MNLGELFTKNVITAGPEETLASVAQSMKEHNVGTVVIVEEQRPIGLVTDRDLALALGAEGKSPEDQVQEVMTRQVVAVPETWGIFTATSCMRDCEVRRLPIVDKEDRLVGIVTMDDLIGCLGRELYNLAEGIKHEMLVK